MPSARVTLCTVLVLLCTSSLAEPTSTRPPRGVPGAKVESVPSKDLFEVLDDTTQRDARSVVAFMCANRLVLKTDGNYEVRTLPLQPPPQGAVSQPVCTDQPFKSQPVAAFCSGVLVTPTVVATSAACLTRAKSECGGAFAGPGASVRAVFGYSMRDALTPPTSLSGADVVPLKRILKQTTERAGNWALVELNQAMEGRAVPLRTEKIRRGTVRVIGHPQGLPTKIAQASSVESSAAFSFTVAPASLGSSLGTPAFSAGQVAVEGLVVDDPISWRCSPSTACCKTGSVPGRGSATTVIRASALASSVCTSATLCGSACVNTSTDVNNCGQCGNTCDLPNATETCSAGGCRIAACEPNRANCDRVISNGCETQLGTLTNCGDCGKVCNLPHAVEACTAGACQVVACELGYGNCDASQANGCESQFGTLIHCSACNDKCEALPNTIPSCNGTCQWSCKDGYADCTDSPGCETQGTCAPACTPERCNDGNPCTIDECNDSQCTHSPATGASCDDGNVCTTTDTCNSSGQCLGTNPAPVKMVSVGDRHSLALRNDGTVWAWGSNTYGQLGDGTTTRRLIPVQISGLNSIVAVVAGTHHSLALRSDGTVWAWGLNADGQLGDGTTGSRLAPVKVSELAGVTTIDAGNHSLALRNDGTVWAWGKNRHGELGDGTTINRLTPGKVFGLTGVTAISAHGHSLALLNDGTVWAWGMNGDGRLGDGTTIERHTPVPVSGLTGVTAVSAGVLHSMVVRNGRVWVWGGNAYGQLGDGSTSAGRLVPFEIPELSGVAKVAAGFGHSMAVLNDGTVWSWGRNNVGQLGDGTVSSSPEPVRVSGLSGVVSAAAGVGYYPVAYSMALLNDGTVKAWGGNDEGQLGDGTSTSRLTPVQVRCGGN